MGEELKDIINSGQEPEHQYFVIITKNTTLDDIIYIIGTSKEKTITVKENCLNDRADLLPSLIEGKNELNQVHLAIIYQRDRDVVLKGEEALVIIEKMNIEYDKDVKFEESIIRSIRRFFRRF